MPAGCPSFRTESSQDSMKVWIRAEASSSPYDLVLPERGRNSTWFSVGQVRRPGSPSVPGMSMRGTAAQTFILKVPAVPRSGSSRPWRSRRAGT